MDRSRPSRVARTMRSPQLVILGVVAACARTPPPTAIPAPVPEVVPACIGDDCSAPLEPAPRFERPDDSERPDAASQAEHACETVGAVAASIQLGNNYADPDILGPAIERHTASCERLSLDQDARTCIARASDKATIAYCAPSFWPDPTLAFVDAGACEGVIARISARVATRSRIDDERRWWTSRNSSRARVLLASCRADRWTVAFAECTRTSLPSWCVASAVAPLRDKLGTILAREDEKDAAAKALWHRAYAEPKKYPQVKVEILGARACAEVMRATVRRLGAVPGTAEAGWWNARAPMFRASCLRDRWPNDFGDCVRERSAYSCQHFAPPLLLAKLQAVFGVPTPPPPPPWRR